MSLRKEIEELLKHDLTLSEIARRTEVARSTVEYHVERLNRVQPASGGLQPPPKAVTEVPTRRLIVELMELGLSRSAIAHQLGLAKATVSYHARRAGAPIDSRCARRYDWETIQRYYDLGHSLSQCRMQFGFSSKTWDAAVKRGAIVPRPARLPTDEFFARGVHRNRTYLKHRLIEEGHKEAKCETCGLTEWRERPLAVALHHINGDRNDNRVENLQLLCPNCHSQTETFSGRNGHRRRGRPGNVSDPRASLK